MSLNNIILELKKNIYLIIPIICIPIWASLVLISTQINPDYAGFLYWDYSIWYGAGRQIFRDPTKLYDYNYGYDIGYTWTPCWASLFAISLSLIPYIIGYFLLYILNVISGMLMIREYNRILILANIRKKSHRFIFLIIISNGFIIFNVFIQNQNKLMIGFFIFYILRRELECRISKIEKNLKYYLINYGLFVFVLGMAPYFIFLLLIYLFEEIRLKKLVKKGSIKIYSIVIVMFLLQNILFFIYPILIVKFLEGFYKNTNFFIFYLYEWLRFSDEQTTQINIIFSIFLFTLTMLLIINKKLRLEQKFAYFSIFAIFFSLFANRILTFLLPLTLLLFLPFLKQELKGKEFIKQNKILLIGLLSVLGLYLNINPETIYFIVLTILPFFNKIVLMFLINIRWILLLIIMACSIIMLNLQSFCLKRDFKQ